MLFLPVSVLWSSRNFCSFLSQQLFHLNYGNPSSHTISETCRADGGFTNWKVFGNVQLNFQNLRTVILASYLSRHNLCFVIFYNSINVDSKRTMDRVFISSKSFFKKPYQICFNKVNGVCVFHSFSFERRLLNKRRIIGWQWSEPSIFWS